MQQQFEEITIERERINRFRDNIKNSDEYNIWKGMKRRCYNSNNKNYHRYGGRGIKIHDEWLKNFESFYNYVRSNLGERPSRKHSIDRYPNYDGNYEPGNIRWATPRQQGQNTKRATFAKVKEIKEEVVRFRKDGQAYKMGRPKEENVIVSKITLGFDKEYTDMIDALSKKMRRSKADTIRQVINHCHQRYIVGDKSDSVLEFDLKIEELAI